MPSVKVAVHGLGNIGRHVVNCLSIAEDIECLGVIRRAASICASSPACKGIPEFPSIEDLAATRGRPDVVILCGPSRSVPVDAEAYLAKGYRTVDSFDIHDEIPEMVKKLDAVARACSCTCISAAGWDPGTDSIIRAVFEAMTPTGVTFTNFGRGRSMGHSVAARAIKGVADAIAITIPLGSGRHSRLVHILAEQGYPFESIKKDLAADPYFCHDPLEVREVKTPREMEMVADNSHGVLMERTGASGTTSNQHLSFDMRIDNPALTAQVLVSCARAVTRLGIGCHTLIDVPPVALLPGSREENIARLV